MKEQEFANFLKKKPNKNAKVANRIMTLGRRSVGKQVGVLSCQTAVRVRTVCLMTAACLTSPGTNQPASQPGWRINSKNYKKKKSSQKESNIIGGVILENFQTKNAFLNLLKAT